MKNLNQKTLSAAFVVILICTVAVFIWPTLYRFDKMHMSGDIFPVRIHRITGNTEILYPSGWIELKTEGAAKLHELAKEDINKLSGKLIVSTEGYFKARIYNGTQKKISEIIVNVTLNGPQKSDPFGIRHELDVRQMLPPPNSREQNTNYYDTLRIYDSLKLKYPPRVIYPISRKFRLTSSEGAPLSVSEWTAETGGFIFSSEINWVWTIQSVKYEE
jgi:hypothetical protein